MLLNFNDYKKAVNENGFTIINNVFAIEQINEIIKCVNQSIDKPEESKAEKDVFAIRKVFIVMPHLKNKIITENITAVIKNIFGPDYFLVKALYFDKPLHFNWFVAYHQDLSIAVDARVETNSFHHWTKKHNQYGVQPNIEILQNIFTIRIHLDDCVISNGALHVIPGSHKNGIYKTASKDWNTDSEVICEVPKGGIMIMKPLLLHASHKSTIQNKRRVLHLEFSNISLPHPLQWAEKEKIF